MGSFIFVMNSIFLGAGLAMDAFSVSIVNALNEPKMRKTRMMKMAGVYAFFQFLMPMIGWICVHTVVQYFRAFEKAIPWIALILLLFIGGKMLAEGIHDIRAGKADAEYVRSVQAVGFGTLMLQGIATSIDALSVGFTIADYGTAMAIYASLMIAVVTFVICMGGLLIGKKVGERITNAASILGGVILIGIGIEIFLRGI